MARLEFFVVAESVSVDQATNQASVFHIFEQIGSVQFPFVMPYCTAISLWCQEPDDRDQDFQCILRIAVPDGETRDFATNFRLTAPRHRVVTRIRGLRIPQPGELRFELLLNGNHVASHLVDVIQVRPLDVAGSHQ